MDPSWRVKGSSRRRGSTHKWKVRWEVLGLQDPAVISGTTSIEDVRRQIISASNHGLSPETRARSREQDGQGDR